MQEVPSSMLGSLVGQTWKTTYCEQVSLFLIEDIYMGTAITSGHQALSFSVFLCELTQMTLQGGPRFQPQIGDGFSIIVHHFSRSHPSSKKHLFSHRHGSLMTSTTGQMQRRVIHGPPWMFSIYNTTLILRLGKYFQRWRSRKSQRFRFSVVRCYCLLCMIEKVHPWNLKNIVTYTRAAHCHHGGELSPMPTTTQSATRSPWLLIEGELVLSGSEHLNSFSNLQWLTQNKNT